MMYESEAHERETEINRRAALVDDPDFLTGIKTLEDAERKQGDIHCALRRAETDAERRRLSTLWGGIEKRVKSTMIPAAQCSNCQAEIRKLWKEHCELFSKYVPTELWGEVRDRVESFWSFK